ncbi:MAG: MIP/aquaporin family protein [Thermocrispum sp.]
MRKYVAEFIGSLFLVLTVAAAVLDQAPLAPLAIGGVLMVMVYAGGHVSGAHYNPAVTFAILLRGRITTTEAAAYVVAQLAGGAAGALIGRWAVDPKDVTALALSGRQLGAALLVEVLFTFALAYVVLNVATSSSHTDNFFYGLAIGFTVLAGVVAVGGISGGAFNPVVAVGGSIAGLFEWSSLWIYLLAQAVGAGLAALAFLALNPHERGARSIEPAAKPDAAPGAEAPASA